MAGATNYSNSGQWVELEETLTITKKTPTADDFTNADGDGTFKLSDLTQVYDGETKSATVTAPDGVTVT